MVAKKKTGTKKQDVYKYVVASYNESGEPTAHKGFNIVKDAETYFDKLKNKPLNPNTQATIVLWKHDGGHKWEELKQVQVAHLSWR